MYESGAEIGKALQEGLSQGRTGSKRDGQDLVQRQVRRDKTRVGKVRDGLARRVRDYRRERTGLRKLGSGVAVFL